jgi:hypothetical protein
MSNSTPRPVGAIHTKGSQPSGPRQAPPPPKAPSGISK